MSATPTVLCQLFWSCSKDMHMFWKVSSDYYLLMSLVAFWEFITNVLRIKFSDSFLLCSVYLISCTFWFHDSSYIKRQTLSKHKLSEFA